MKESLAWFRNVRITWEGKKQDFIFFFFFFRLPGAAFLSLSQNTAKPRLTEIGGLHH